MTLKDSELKSILAEVETEMADLLKNEAAALKKAKDDEGSEDSGEASASAPAEDSAPAEASSPAPEGSAPAADASASPAPEASSPAPEMGAPEASASAPAGDPSAPAADPAADVVADPEALKAEYSKLGLETLKAHYIAAKAALFEVMGAAAGAGAPGAAGPEASASAPAPMPAPAAPEASNTTAAPVPPPAMKAEVPASIKNIPATASLDNAGGTGGKGGLDDVKKSEEIADLKAQVELLTKAIDLSLGQPMRKAITSSVDVPAPEVKKDLTKSEIKAKLNKAMASGKLSKAQREDLFSYTLGNKSFDEIKGLLD